MDDAIRKLAEEGQKTWGDGRNLELTSIELHLQPEEIVRWVSSGKRYLDAGCGEKAELIRDVAQLGLKTEIQGCDIFADESNPLLIREEFHKIAYPANYFDRVSCIASICTYAKDRTYLIQDVLQLSRIMTLEGRILMFLNPATIQGFVLNFLPILDTGIKVENLPKSPLEAHIFRVENFQRTDHLYLPLLEIMEGLGLKVRSKWIAGSPRNKVINDDGVEEWENVIPHNLAVEFEKTGNINPIKALTLLTKYYTRDSVIYALKSILNYKG